LSVFEVLELELDVALDPSLFVYEPGPGERVRSSTEPSYAVELQLQLEEAAARAPFHAFAPHEPGAGMHIVAADLDAGRSLSIVYMHETSEAILEIEERIADPDHEPDRGAEQVELSGYDAFVTAGEPTVVELVRGGTHIELSSSDLGRDDLLRVALSLEP